MSKQPELSEDIPLWSGIAYIAQKLYMPNHNLPGDVTVCNDNNVGNGMECDSVNGRKVGVTSNDNALNDGKVDVRVGSFAHWLHHNEPDAVDKHQHYATGGGQLTLEQWADVHHPELREIWAIVRYRGDI